MAHTVHMLLANAVFASSGVSRSDAQVINDALGSLFVQLIMLGVYALLGILAFTRVARDFTDEHRWLRAAIVGLGVFLGLEVLLGSGLLDLVIWPFWVQVPVTIWLFGLTIYYIFRALTTVRPGAGDPEAQVRGSALEYVLDEAEGDLRGADPGAQA